MKSLLVIADGLGGRPTDIDGKTCLEKAKTPALDRLTERGAVGLMDPIKPGIRPGSDTSHLSIFGYDPEEYYTGRGVFEAAGIGMDVKPGDVCFRTNFATLNERGEIEDRRAGRIQEGQDKLEEALGELHSEEYPGVEVIFRASTEHRGALLLRGKDLGDKVTDTDPHQLGIVPPKAEGEDDPSQKTARVLNEVLEQAGEILVDHPFNKGRRREGELPVSTLLTRGAARYPHVPSVKEVYGIDASVIAAGALYIGVAKIVGMEFKSAEGATGTLDSNILNKVKLARDEFGRGKDLVFVHFKGTDNASHDHDAPGKVQFIEKIDRTFAWLADHLNWDETHLAFAGDHTTPIQFGDHVADPVPVLFAGPNVRRDKIERFDEIACADGGLNRFSGQLLPTLLSYSNIGEKFGA